MEYKSAIIFGILVVILNLSIYNCQICTSEANIDYFGNDLPSTPLTFSTAELCCNACNTNPVCQAWSFVNATSQCWLKSAIGGIRVNSTGRVSGFRSSGAAAFSTLASTTTTTLASSGPCYIEQNVNYPGNDLTNRNNVASAADCCTICSSTQNCVAFSYIIQSQVCFLKAALPIAANRQAFTGIISGQKRV